MKKIILMMSLIIGLFAVSSSVKAQQCSVVSNVEANINNNQGFSLNNTNSYKVTVYFVAVVEPTSGGRSQRISSQKVVAGNDNKYISLDQIMNESSSYKLQTVNINSVVKCD